MALPKDELNDTLKDGIPERGKLSNAEQWRQMAAAGDVRGLLDEMRRAVPGMFNFQDFGEHVHQALDVLARSNPSSYADFLQGDVMAAVGKMVVRAHLMLDQHLSAAYEDRKNRGTWINSEELETLTMKLTTLHLHVARLQQMSANTRNLLEQARRLRLANDKAEAKKARTRQPTRRRRLSPTRPQPAAASSRIGDGLP